MTKLSLKKSCWIAGLLSVVCCGCSVFESNPPGTETYVPTGNPIFTHKFTADPAPVVIGDTLWLITSHDGKANETFYNMPDYRIFSTKDMKTWKEYPTPFGLPDIKWDTSKNAYAAQMTPANGKYYLYFSTNGCGLGVAVADKPYGPYTDCLGKPLITVKDCPGLSHSWAAIDPSVFIDDDGQAWLFWGNGGCFCAKLKPNMIELDGPVKRISFPNRGAYTEGPWIFKNGKKYYLAFGMGMPMRVGYAMADSIEGPWTHMGELCGAPPNCGTAHPGIANFKGQWYLFYHNGAVPNGGGSFSRSVCVDKMYFNEDGTIKKVEMTKDSIFGK